MRLIIISLLAALIPATAWAAGDGAQDFWTMLHLPKMGDDVPFGWEVYLSLAVATLGIIVTTTMKDWGLWSKASIFVSLGIFAYAFLGYTGGATAELIHVFHVDYPQFILIPGVTVLIASMNLLALKVGDDFKPGWFMWITVPLIGNFATTWALVPIAVSLFPILKRLYPHSYWTKMILMFIFGANILALGTVLADPPQAYWAVQLANAGTPMAFFYTGSKFWLFMLITWLFYGGMLKYIGVEFGEFKLSNVVPKFESLWKVALAIGFCLSIAYALLYLNGYGITLFLLVIFAIGVFIATVVMKDHKVKHDTIHWCVETFTIFIAFFSVVAFMHVMLANLDMSNEAMVGAVMVLTWMADNAAAFAAGYPQFVGNEQLMLWYNLFPSVTQGSMSPLGNGPQIVAFLVIFCGMGAITPKEVFIQWMKAGLIFGPYLFTWTFEAMDHQGIMTVPSQLAIGLLAVAVSFAFLWFVEQIGISLRSKKDND